MALPCITGYILAFHGASALPKGLLLPQRLLIIGGHQAVVTEEFSMLSCHAGESSTDALKIF